MAEKVQKIHSLSSDGPWVGGIPPAGSTEHPLTIRALDRVMAIQRPVVLAHLRSVRLRHPEASPQEIVGMLERRFLAAVTTSGAAVGATAVVPGIGTGITLALSGAETIGFLEACALFAQSLAEVHGIPVESPERARALVLTLMLGQEGIDLVAQLTKQAAGKGPTRDRYWGELITKTLPRAAVGPMVDRLKATFVRQFATRGSASWIGKALPFGIGAAIGGVGNHVLGRRVMITSRRAFGPAPATLPPELEPQPGTLRIERAAGATVARATSALGKAVGTATKRTGTALRPRSKKPRKEIEE
ncbi:hypothetical protein FHX49_000282 [Microbacterium endophyticum]|uniref:Di-and tripeptidase n=1 Tax=Microbacterium endophyticum TaxID=1526412 RepID=A0A7W4YMK3_9MICO|nr:hypothetical protein [Microbacterium endophyticum]MBB2974741.1 hypothetical protein [Microbacterium endophyticum]NIK37038.1 hypothetical protein [Microbacterium endophyticum]